MVKKKKVTFTKDRLGLFSDYCIPAPNMIQSMFTK